MASTHITVRISPELKEKLQEMAQAERRTLSQFVALMLEDGVAQREHIETQQSVRPAKKPK